MTSKVRTMEASELIARLEAASEGDVELDAAIAVLAQDIPTPRHVLKDGFRQECRLGNDDRSVEVWTVGPGYEDRYARYSAKPYTTSLDAIVALIERKLPDWWVQYLGQTTRGWAVRIERQGTSLGLLNSTTPALALCIALLRALQHQGEAERG